MYSTLLVLAKLRAVERAQAWSQVDLGSDFGIVPDCPGVLGLVTEHPRLDFLNYKMGTVFPLIS